MNSLFDAMGSVANATSLPDLAWFLVRLTIVAALGHVALTLLRRAPAATRHVVALAAIGATIIVPLGTELLPAWKLPLLPARRVPAIALVIRPEAPLTVGSVPSADESWAPPASVSAGDDALPASDPATPAPAPWRAALPPLPVSALVIAVMLAGTVAMVARFELGLCVAWLTSWNAEDVDDERLLQALARARQRLGLSRVVRLKSSRWIDVPVVFGIRGPTLIVPADAAHWSDERLRSVLLHELAHVARRDGLGQLLVNAATALYWFHPFVWMLARDARRDCERACDDVVLGNGVRASDYAQDLLAIAQAAHRERFATMTLAFSRRSSLEDRLLSILKADAPRGPASKRAVMSALAALLLVIPLATVRVIAAPADVNEMLIGDPAMRDVPSRALSETGSPSKTQTTAERAAAHEASTAVTTADAASAASAAAEAHEPMSVPEVPGVPTIVKVQPVPAPDDVRFETAGSRNGESWWDTARELYRKERYDQAGVAYENAAKADYRADVAWYNAACSYALDNQRTRALGALKNALNEGFDQLDLLQKDTDLNSIRNDSRFQLLLDEVMKSDVNEPARRASTRRYDVLKSSNSSDADRWGHVGIDLMRAGETDRAVDAFQRQVKIEGEATGIYNMACAYALGGKKDKAFETLEQSINAGYGDPEKITSDPDLYSLHGDARFDKMVDLAADLELFGPDLHDDNRASWDDAMPRFQQAVKDYPNSGRAWFNLGYAQLRVRDAKNALVSFKRSLDLGYRKPTSMYNLACSAAQAGDKEAAIQWLQKAQTAGFTLEWKARWDRDLFPLRSDPRFREMINRWDREQRKTKHDKTDKSAFKYDYQYDETGN
jgi:beta-lactamase regulating signal transducer with metallopeptidase domain